MQVRNIFSIITNTVDLHLKQKFEAQAQFFSSNHVMYFLCPNQYSKGKMVWQQESDALGKITWSTCGAKLKDIFQYLQMCRRFRKFFCNLVKIIAHRRTFYGITEVVKLTTAVPCYWAQKWGSETTSTIMTASTITASTITTPRFRRRLPLLWCHWNG